MEVRRNWGYFPGFDREKKSQVEVALILLTENHNHGKSDKKRKNLARKERAETCGDASTTPHLLTMTFDLD